MCNACGFRCCASDMFAGCGCDHCANSDCWDLDEDDESFDDCGDCDFSPSSAPLVPVRVMRCEAVRP